MSSSRKLQEEYEEMKTLQKNPSWEPPKNKTLFFGKVSQMWLGGVADSQTRSKPLKTPQIAPKIAFFDPNFTFRSPKSHNNPNPGVGGWLNRFGRYLQKKNVFLRLP